MTFKKNELEKLKNLSNYEFCDFGIFNSASNTFEDMMQEEDFNKANFYLLGSYIERAYIDVKRVND